VEKLIRRIRPATHSERRRESVSNFMEDIIIACFAPVPVQAFMFGSVPLKTYLPDGDIDLCIFSPDTSIKDTWATRLHAKLEEEQQSPHSPFKIGDVQVINAEVKLLKCLVDNLVVDVSFNQLGGLCALNFLEEINRNLQPDHMLKKSIILVKAWCYYESRLLGAHHGLLSTYALEVLVLFVFNLHHAIISNPLEVLYLFLHEFGSFDWDNYCLSLHGAAPLSSFPNFHVETPPALARCPLIDHAQMAAYLEKYNPQKIATDLGAATAGSRASSGAGTPLGGASTPKTFPEEAPTSSALRTDAASSAKPQQQQQQQQQQHKRQLLLQSLRPLSSSPASAGQRACASTSAADEVRSLACTQHIPWVETGDTVSKQYADARSEARDWCRLRNHCFQQATLAYCNGNKALAKELSIKGRSAADKMWEAHASAADTILATRNAKHREKRASLYQISCGAHPHFVDLHGLHVQEALAVIAQYLEEGTSTPAGGHKGNVLRVCVGTGHHTMGPTANAPRLAAAVMNALREWGVRYRVLQPGLLEVLL